MRNLLARQMDEKNMREQAVKANYDEQAVIWSRDKSNYEEEERRLASKIKGINAQNQAFLQRQMAEKESKQAQRKMNR